jgi:hypothetical protein
MQVLVALSQRLGKLGLMEQRVDLPCEAESSDVIFRPQGRFELIQFVTEALDIA